MSRLFATACFLIVTATSAIGIRGNDNSVAIPDELLHRQLHCHIHEVTYAKIGCFNDNLNKRVFNTLAATGKMTPRICAKHCIYGGKAAFFGVQNGNECWCGDSHTKVSKFGKADGKCTTPCQGNEWWNCGAFCRFEAYAIGVPEPPVGHLGCVRDKKNNKRLFKHCDPVTDRYMTLEKCKNICSYGNKFAYFGLQNGDECHCGVAEESNFRRYGKKDGQCMYRCTGDIKQVCGGKSVMDVYNINKPLPPRPGNGARYRTLPVDYNHRLLEGSENDIQDFELVQVEDFDLDFVEDFEDEEIEDFEGMEDENFEGEEEEEGA